MYVAVPDGLEDGVGEAEDHEVLHGLLAEVVIDAEDVFIFEDAAEHAVEVGGGLDIAAEGLFDNDPLPGTPEPGRASTTLCLR